MQVEGTERGGGGVLQEGRKRKSRYGEEASRYRLKIRHAMKKKVSPARLPQQAFDGFDYTPPASSIPRAVA